MAKKKPRKTNLALERLLLWAALFEVVNQVLDLLSKVVNYARIRERQV